MNLSPTVTDNLTELLSKILDFTERRRIVLTRNMIDCDKPGFVPKDLDTKEFANVMSCAVAEHIQNDRLMFCDAENIKFGKAGNFDIFPVVDKKAKKLFENDIESYFELQIEKLSNNLINTKIARQLIKQKHGNATTATL